MVIGTSSKIVTAPFNSNLPADRIIVIKQFPPMMDTQGYSTCYIRGRPSANTDDTVPPACNKSLSPFLYIRFHRVFVNIRKHFHRNRPDTQTLFDLLEKVQLRYHRVGHQQWPAQSCSYQVLGQFFYRARPKSYCRRKIVLSYYVEVFHIISKYLFNSQSVTTCANCRHSHSRVLVK